jgi:hypothetical protein
VSQSDTSSDVPSDVCPRCGRGFHCGVSDAAPCACTTVSLNAATLAELRRRYTRCLCMACLAQLAAKEKAGPV